jgi:hypothetical protein
MIAQTGDIVRLNGRNWVVGSPYPSPNGTPWAHLTRPMTNGRPTGHVRALAGLQVVERPVYPIGLRVKVDGKVGTITEVAAGEATVQLDPYRQPLKGGGTILHAGKCTAPLWRITLENAL